MRGWLSVSERRGSSRRSEMSVDVLEPQALRDHDDLQVVQQLRDLFRRGIRRLVLGGHPHLGSLFDDLLADVVHSGIELGDGTRSLGPLDRFRGELGEQLVERLHHARVAGVTDASVPRDAQDPAQRGAWRCAASARRAVIAASGSSAPKTAEPATNVSAPASAARSMVAAEMPPSTCSHTADPRRRASAARAESFGIVSGMNDWPPKPGSTVMTSTWSNSSRCSKRGSAGVPGLTATPARAPIARSRRARATGSADASTWKVTDAAPSSA